MFIKGGHKDESIVSLLKGEKKQERYTPHEIYRR